VGYPNSATTGNDIATLWKNGSAAYLSDGTQKAGAESVAISGSDVYISGYQFSGTTNQYAVNLWKNGTATTLADVNASTVVVNAPSILVQ
jgi:hypothetical protein